MKRLLFVSFLAGATFVSYGQTIAQWTFESIAVAPGSPSAGVWLTNLPAEFGSGTASALHAGNAAYSIPSGNGSAKSLSVNTWSVGDLFQFEVSTVGYIGISVAFDIGSSQTGPGRFNLSYSTDGTTFTTQVNNFVVQQNGGTGAIYPAWNSTTGTNAYSLFYDLSSITALDNASTVYFRLVDSSTTSASGGTVNASAGTTRVDTFTVSMVPEPSAFALTGLGAVAAVFAARRKRCWK
jgi:hypothetical protein